MGQHVHAQLPVHPAGHQRGIHPCPGNGAVRNGQQVRTGSLQPTGTLEIRGQVSVLGGIQLHRDDPLSDAQLAQKGIVRFHCGLCRCSGLCRRGGGQRFRQSIQRGAQGSNVLRGRATAAAQNAHALTGKAAQFPGKIFRLALIAHLCPRHHRVARIGHDRKRQPRIPQLLHQCPHRARGRYAVQAYGIHHAALRHAAHQLGTVAALPGVAVRQHRKGYQYKGLRHSLLQRTNRFQHTVLGAQGLEQKIPCTQQRKALCHSKIHLLRREIFGIRCGAKVGKHCRAGLPGGLCCQLPACIRQLLPARLLCRRQTRQAEGIGLDGVRSGGKIRPVHCQNALGVGQVCLLAFLPRFCFIIGTHAAIEQQRPLG